MQGNMPKPHKKRFLTYCRDCEGYTMQQPSEWMLKHMYRNKIDTWVIQKFCESCFKKRKDDKK